MPLNSIHPKAKVGKNVAIGSFTTIEEDVVIGDNTAIGPHVTIMSGARIGHNCQIFPGAVIGAIPQDLKFRGEKTKVIIGNHTTIREYVTINRGTSSTTFVGNHVLLMAYVHIAHDCTIADKVVIANTTQVAGHVTIDYHAVLGGKVVVHQYIHIGAYTMVASGTTIRKNVPPFIKIAREPIRYCGINTIGLQRCNFTLDLIHTLEKVYYIIYQQGLPLQVALTFLQNNFTTSDKEVTMILDFIQQSKNGIIKKI